MNEYKELLMMKALLIWIVILVACETKKSDDSTVQKNDYGRKTELPDSSKKEQGAPLYFLKNDIGKYPKQINMFEKEPLQTRLEKLLDDQYEEFIKNWNTETPIQHEDNVLHTSGCKSHECAMNAYDLYVDLNTNTINVYHIKNGKERIYKEKDKEIKLPSGFAEEIKIKRQNASLEVLPPRL